MIQIATSKYDHTNYYLKKRVKVAVNFLSGAQFLRAEFFRCFK